jgi:hypothetical protein
MRVRGMRVSAPFIIMQTIPTPTIPTIPTTHPHTECGWTQER